MTEVMDKQGIVTPVKAGKPSAVQLRYLERGLEQPGGKLPLFDHNGQRIKDATIRSCIKHGWCEPWAHNPIKPDWVVCKLTDNGRRLFQKSQH